MHAHHAVDRQPLLLPLLVELDVDELRGRQQAVAQRGEVVAQADEVAHHEQLVGLLLPLVGPATHARHVEGGLRHVCDTWTWTWRSSLGGAQGCSVGGAQGCSLAHVYFLILTYYPFFLPPLTHCSPHAQVAVQSLEEGVRRWRAAGIPQAGGLARVDGAAAMLVPG